MAQCKKGLGYRHIQTPGQMYKNVFIKPNKIINILINYTYLSKVMHKISSKVIL